MADNPEYAGAVESIVATSKQLGADSEVIHRFRFGRPDETVETETGPVPTLAGIRVEAGDAVADEVADRLNEYVGAFEEAEQNAAESATSANASRQQAQIAQTAANAAATAGRYRSSIAAGVSGSTAVPNGETFNVLSADGQNIEVRRNDNGTASDPIARIPTDVALKGILGLLLPAVPPGLALAFRGAFGRVAVALRKNGIFDIARLGLPVTFENGDTITTRVPEGFVWAIRGPLGRVAAGLKTNGEFVVARLNAQEIAGVATQAASYVLHADINAVINYGQSTSVGGQAGVISTSTTYNNLMYAGGLRGTDRSSFVGLVESKQGDLGETQVSGMFDQIKALLGPAPYQLLGSSPGVSGAAAAEIQPGTTAFGKIEADITAGYQLAQAAGKSIRFSAMVYTQGETETKNQIAPATWKATVLGIFNTYAQRAAAGTGQGGSVVFIINQLASHSHYFVDGATSAKDNPIGRAQIELMNENDNVFVACPQYIFTYVDDVHFTAESYRWMGAYDGLAYYNTVVLNNRKWRPLTPLSVTVQGRVVTVEYNPVGRLVVDKTAVAAAPNLGFTAQDASGNALSIDSVSLSSATSLSIVLTSAPPAKWQLRYALDPTTSGTSGPVTGPRGNIRDAQGEQILFDPNGLNKPMHNWSLAFATNFGA